MSEHRPVAVFGARSYSCAELLRLLSFHSTLRPGILVSRSATGAMMSALHPHVAGILDDLATVEEEAAFERLKDDPQMPVVLCLGSGESAQTVLALDERGLLERRKLVDLSGDFRLQDPHEYRRWYGAEHPCPHLIKRFDYGIPELHRSRCTSDLVSNPGCFATAVQFACWPALRSGVTDDLMQVFAVTGSSGSGSRAKDSTHHPRRAHDFFAYKVLGHQHTPEIAAGLGVDLERLFLTTHSSPLVRGIHVSVHLQLNTEGDGEALRASYQALADAEAMVTFSDGPVSVLPVIGTNRVALGLCIEGSRAVAFAAIDNLTRGASGQALQNLNRLMGFAETDGTNFAGMNPC